MNKAQMLDRALCRVERAAMSILERAETYADTETAQQRRWAREALLASSREYAMAIRNLARVT